MAHFPIQLDFRLKAHFGFGVDDMWSGRVTILEAASALTLVPDGDPLWKTLGGPRALSSTDLSRIQLSYMLAGLQYQQSDGKGKKPQPEKPPPITVVEQRKRAEHRQKVRKKVGRRNRLTPDQMKDYYRKQAEVDKNGKQHPNLQSLRGDHSHS